MGRKRHIVVDTLGLIHGLLVHEASVPDRRGAEPLLEQLGWREYRRLQVVYADSAYKGPLEDWAAEKLGLSLLVVPKLVGQSTFIPLPKRWIVERTFAWLLKCRRLSRDCEALVESSEAYPARHDQPHAATALPWLSNASAALLRVPTAVLRGATCNL